MSQASRRRAYRTILLATGIVATGAWGDDPEPNWHSVTGPPAPNYRLWRDASTWTYRPGTPASGETFPGDIAHDPGADEVKSFNAVWIERDSRVLYTGDSTMVRTYGLTIKPRGTLRQESGILSGDVGTIGQVPGGTLMIGHYRDGIAPAPGDWGLFELAGGELRGGAYLGIEGNGWVNQTGGIMNMAFVGAGVNPDPMDNPVGHPSTYLNPTVRGLYQMHGTAGNPSRLIGVTVGYSAIGDLYQYANTLVTNSVEVGYNPTAVGKYHMVDGSIGTSVDPSTLVYVGVRGKGYFYQDNGIVDVESLFMGGEWQSESNPSYGFYRLGQNSPSSNPSLTTWETQVGLQGSADFNQIKGTHNTQTLTVDSGPGLSSSYSLSAGTLNAVVQESLATSENSSAYFFQDGGANTTGTLAVGVGSYASYEMYGGTLDTGSSIIGIGDFQQYGGTHTVTGDLQVSQLGSYYLIADTPEAAVLHTANENVYGYFYQSGGTNTVDGRLMIRGSRLDPENPGSSATGSYQLTGGGVLHANSIWMESDNITGRGSFVMDNSTVSVDTTIHLQDSDWQQTGGSVSANAIELATNSSPSTWTQNGGTVSAHDLGISAATYTLNNNGTVSLTNLTMDSWPNTYFYINSGQVNLAAGVATLAGGTMNIYGSFNVTNNGTFGVWGTNVNVKNGGLLSIAASKLSVGSNTLTIDPPANGGPGGELRLNNANVEVLLSEWDIGPGANSSNTLTKTGTGQLNINPGFVFNPGSVLDVQQGTVQMNTDGTTNAAIQVNGSNTKVKLNHDQNLHDLIVSHGSANTQSLDLNSPTGPGEFRSVKVYATDINAKVIELDNAIKNANRPGAADPNDGIYDTNLLAHFHNSGDVGIGAAHGPAGGPFSYAYVRPALLGDANLDGCVTISDYIEMNAHWNQPSGATWEMGDFNYDGAVTIADSIALNANWNRCWDWDYPGGGGAPMFASAVPEPAVCINLLVAGSLLLARRRRACGSARGGV